MEAEERPAKLLKLSDDADVAIAKNSNLNEQAQPEQNDHTGDGQYSTEQGDTQALDSTDAIPSQDLLTIDSSLITGPADPAPPLSKSAQKKLRKRQEWEAGREDRKIKRREYNKIRKERKREARAAQPAEALLKRRPAIQLPVTFLIDCSFDELMQDKERVSLSSQITRCYSDNHKAPFRGHMAVTSFQGELRTRFDVVLAKVYERWKGFLVRDEGFKKVAEETKQWMTPPRGGKLEGAFKGSEATPEDGEVVYLSSEADETLMELKPYSTYIVGGLVDKNRHKGICHRRATEQGIRTARLPIGEYLSMSSRKVLTTNHVVEIMVRWLECGDWGEAFMKVMPKRKGGILKEKRGSGIEADADIKEEDDCDYPDDFEEAEGGDSGEEEATEEPADMVQEDLEQEDGEESDDRSGGVSLENTGEANTVEAAQGQKEIATGS